MSPAVVTDMQKGCPKMFFIDQGGMTAEGAVEGTASASDNGGVVAVRDEVANIVEREGGTGDAGKYVELTCPYWPIGC